MRKKRLSRVRTAHRFLRIPLGHFVLLGALLFGAKQWWWPTDDALPAIQVSPAALERLRAEWTRETARTPTPAQLRASLQRHVDEEILLREALRLRLDTVDPVARERLVANMRFAFPESRRSEPELLAEARALGLNVRDIVVRRRLVQVMEMRIVGQAGFTQAELQDYVAAHPERYAGRPRYAFRQVFVGMDESPAQAERRAQQLLARLRAQPQAKLAGDPFLLGTEFPPQSVGELERAFGAGFGEALAGLQPAVWSGPLRSAYGLHLVQVDRIEPAPVPAFEEVSRRAAYALLAEREQTVLREELVRLRQRYRVEWPEAGTSTVTVGMLP